MYVGQLFRSYAEFITVLKVFEKDNFVCFYKRDSRKIDATYPNQELQFCKLKFNCVRGGIVRPEGTGKRKTSTFKIDCPAHISLRATTDGQNLEIRSLNVSHNHEISEELFRHLPQQRKLPPEIRVHAKELLDLDVNKKLLQQKLQSDTGKVITLKDLSNLAAQDKISNNLGEAVTLLQEKYVVLGSVNEDEIVEESLNQEAENISSQENSLRVEASTPVPALTSTLTQVAEGSSFRATYAMLRKKVKKTSTSASQRAASSIEEKNKLEIAILKNREEREKEEHSLKLKLLEEKVKFQENLNKLFTNNPDAITISLNQ